MRGEKFRRFFERLVFQWITPACAGKSIKEKQNGIPLWDHPRMRGEKLRPIASSAAFLGSPPHARGKAVCLEAWPMMRRITPACAGKRSQAKSAKGMPGITPACAGKREGAYEKNSTYQDHPRMRGEKLELRGESSGV